ncbi:hypothetical protein ABE007_03660 [Bacillus altitudinis]|uniref:hypothetical protein n=2 Tax=Bacillus altitudinis TaxID=293387 RepID=UPI00045C8D95|nr:hypothetical protein [Bacillus altitudinis]KDE32467.1 hypothetical protein BA79_00900 [Bacillus altitudinis 41KF2b]MDG3044023.1 hypothetical protein [Bacillus sp. B6(2022)]MEC1042957.1 hypothetical protein [Bacillus altitudinis]MEC1089121.1 hypothetical protein [Bacillus altitudinis]
MMKKSNTLLLSSIFLASTIFPATVSATTVEKNETEWITIAEDTATDSVSHSTNKKSAKADYVTNWKLRKTGGLIGEIFQCNYSMLTTAKSKGKIDYIEAKSRLYGGDGGLSKSKTDSAKKSNYAGANAAGGVDGGWGCKGKAIGNSLYKDSGYKTVSRQKTFKI